MIDAEHRTAAPLARLRLAGRVLVMLLLAAGLVAAWLHRGALDPTALTATLTRYPATPVIFLLVHVAASLLFVPRTVMAVAAGLLFGIAGGILWAALGSVSGAVAGFLVARYVNGGLIDPESMPRIGPILLKAERGGWRSVAALRLIPILPHSLVNYALGLTRLSLASFTFGSLLGQLPMTVAYVDLGAAGERVMTGKAGWLEPTLIGLGALVLLLLLPRLRTRRS
jgi:uncharacterized membrane protein YdjX (TVP38/TMEM64 family)